MEIDPQSADVPPGVFLTQKKSQKLVHPPNSVSSRADSKFLPVSLTAKPGMTDDENLDNIDQVVSTRKTKKPPKPKAKEDKNANKELSKQSSKRSQPNAEEPPLVGTESLDDKHDNSLKPAKRRKRNVETEGPDDTSHQSGDNDKHTKKHHINSLTHDEEDANLAEITPKVAKRRTRAEVKEAKLEASRRAQKEHHENALNYVKVYETSRKNPEIQWKFNKARQNWIIRHLWDKDAIPASDFNRVVEYLKGMQGSSKEVLVKSCHEILNPPLTPAPDLKAETASSEGPPTSTENKDMSGKTKSILKATPSKPPTPAEIELKTMKEERARLVLGALQSK